MDQNENKLDQRAMLRLLVGGYLVYLAWDLLNSIEQSPLFLIAVAVFGLSGAVLAADSLKRLLRRKPEQEPEEKADP